MDISVTEAEGFREDERPLIPDPYKSDVQQRRFYHHDIPGLSAERAWAEAELLKVELARRLFENRRPRVIYSHGCDCITDLDWLRERLRRLSKERRAAAA
jgi:hypothetical protein